MASRQEGLDPVGATVGQRGGRVQSVVAELGGEKIDIIPWNEDPAVFVANALQPAQVVKVDIDEDARIASVTVPERMLSLAIGREGQNARLAAKLTGWRIDIRSDTAPPREGPPGSARRAPPSRKPVAEPVRRLAAAVDDENPIAAAFAKAERAAAEAAGKLPSRPPPRRSGGLPPSLRASAATAKPKRQPDQPSPSRARCQGEAGRSRPKATAEAKAKPEPKAKAEPKPKAKAVAASDHSVAAEAKPAPKATSKAKAAAEPVAEAKPKKAAKSTAKARGGVIAAATASRADAAFPRANLRRVPHRAAEARSHPHCPNGGSFRGSGSHRSPGRPRRVSVRRRLVLVDRLEEVRSRASPGRPAAG